MRKKDNQTPKLRFRLLDDQATTVDLLNYSGFKDTFVSLIMESDQGNTPLCLGIFGPAGCGKTSLMRMIHDELIPNRNLQVAWFEYPYFQDTPPILALFLNSLVERVKDSLGGESLEKAGNILGILNDTILKQWLYSKNGEFDQETPKSQAMNLFMANSANVRNLIQELISVITGNSKTLIIFIDNVDKAINIGESYDFLCRLYELFMSPNVITILALDKKGYQQQLAYKLFDGDQKRAQEGLMRLFQLYFTLPALPLKTTIDYLLHLGVEPEMIENLEQVAGKLEQIPRKVKSFLNVLRFIGHTARSVSVQPKVKLIIAILMHRWPEVFDDMLFYRRKFQVVIARLYGEKKDPSEIEKIVQTLPLDLKEKFSRYIKMPDLIGFFRDNLRQLLSKEILEFFVFLQRSQEEVQEDVEELEPQGDSDETIPAEMDDHLFVGEYERPLSRDEVIYRIENKQSLEGANLVNADLRDLELDGISFKGCDLTGASFIGTSLKKANFEGAVLQETNFENATCMDANFSRAQASMTMFNNANLWGANLSEANCHKASFRSTNLRSTAMNGADLSFTNLMAAEMVDANLAEANLTGIIIDQHTLFHFANIAGATIEEKTIEILRKKYQINEKGILMPKLPRKSS